MTEAQYQGILEKAFGEHRLEVEAHYPRTNYPSPAMAWAAIYTDLIPRLNRIFTPDASILISEWGVPRANVLSGGQ